MHDVSNITYNLSIAANRNNNFMAIMLLTYLIHLNIGIPFFKNRLDQHWEMTIE